MNAQLIFDVVLHSIRAQGGSSSGPDGTCQYRGGGGRRCAVGVWISDSYYYPDLEGKCFDGLLGYVELPSWFREHAPLFRSLQTAHDNASGAYGPGARYHITDADFFLAWEAKMESVAKVYNLTYTPPGIPLPEAEFTYKELVS